MKISREKSSAALVIGLTICITMLYQLITALIIYLVPEKNSPAYIPWIVSSNQIIFMLLPALLFAKWLPISFYEVFRLNRSPRVRQYIFGFLGIMSIFFFAAGWTTIQESIIPEQMMQSYREISKSIEESYRSVLGGDSAWGYFQALLVGALIPAICEEALYRGYLQRSLEELLSPVKAIFISGILFGIIHFNPISMLPLVMIGLFLAISAYFSRSIALPIMLHFLNNAIVISAAYNGGYDSPDFNSPQEVLPMFTAILAVIAGAALAAASGYGLFKYSDIIDGDNPVSA